MFVFEFERALFRFKAKTPAFAPLFQLPPRLGSRSSHITRAPFLQALEPAANHAADLIKMTAPDFVAFE